jgi:RNA polymerase sigma-70 factor (ECF subfamily)
MVRLSYTAKGAAHLTDHPSEEVAAIQRGDRAVLERVIRSCLPGLLRTARSAGLPADRAEDAVQAALLVFVQRAADFDGSARPGTWIHGILARKIWEARRSEGRDAEREELDEVHASRFDAAGSWVRPPAGPVEALARGEFRRELADCLDGLSERQRMAFTLREVEGFDLADICKILGVSANNLGVILFRARTGLRECLESKGFEGSGDVAVR